MSKTILILNGPNLNMLGQRQPEIYGGETLNDVATMCAEAAGAFDAGIVMRQSNHEGELVTWIQEARDGMDAIVINPGAYSHSSIAILDALNMFEGPVMEVHVSNIHAREAFRHHSYVSGRADAIIAGCGVDGYTFAVQRIGKLLA
ncbi:MAG: type II 3-dehydroquinate dehydratase [Paracoccaceae bacterium]|nr:type II 3-dehydroquinate dehydratase [Paracoccaceae bacterium]